MAIVYMNDVSIARYIPENQRNTLGYDYSEELSAAGNGDTVIIPETITGISVTLEVTAGAGKIQASTTPVSEIIATEASAVWVDWDNGEVTATTQDRVSPVSALRVVNASGTTKMTLRGQ